jgi:GT2 family glycosyltransferase
MTSRKEADTSAAWPTVTVVFLAYDRREDLRISLIKTLEELDYPKDRLDVIVVDNASTDGTAEMVASDFPSVRVIGRSWNCGVSGWNDGFAVATGDYVLALDDDCYRPSDGLRRAIAEAERQGAHLVSFAVKSSKDENHRFDIDTYVTGLFSFWGCAVLVRREALDSLHGFDPEIFVWAHELEFMLRFFDRGFRHLHLPEVVAVHAKEPEGPPGDGIPERPLRLNARNWGYIAAKLLRPRDATAALVALLVRDLSVGLYVDRVALKALPDTTRGFLRGLRHRQPVRPEVSHTYRQDFHTFASPWRIGRRSVRQVLRDTVLPNGQGTRGPERLDQWLAQRDRWLAERGRFYPERHDVLEL